MHSEIVTVEMSLMILPAGNLSILTVTWNWFSNSLCVFIVPHIFQPHVENARIRPRNICPYLTFLYLPLPYLQLHRRCERNLRDESDHLLLLCLLRSNHQLVWSYCGCYCNEMTEPLDKWRWTRTWIVYWNDVLLYHGLGTKSPLL